MFNISNVSLGRVSSYFLKHKYLTKMQRGYGQWSKVDLPLGPKVFFAHEEMKKALKKCEHIIPTAYTKEIREKLTAIRKVNWNVYNSLNNYTETQQAKQLLLDLVECKPNLPLPLKKQLETVNVFGSLKDAIYCIDARNAPKWVVYR